MQARFQEQLEQTRLANALGYASLTNHLIMSVQWPGMPQSLALEQLHMLAAEVFPKVRQG